MGEALSFCDMFYQSREGASPINTAIQEWSPIVFVEPCCGDGRIIQALVDSLSSSQTNGKRHCVLAYDIDENATAQCKVNVARHTYSTSVSISTQTCNFLELSRDELLSRVTELTQISNALDHFHFVFDGGPPYSSGAGSGASISRDLPSQFVMHSISNLGAEFVSFLVPRRCNNEINDVEEMLEKETETKWKCEPHELENSLFNFQGRIVTQPSVLQCWRKPPTLT